MFTLDPHPFAAALGRRLDRSPASAAALRYALALGTVTAVVILLQNVTLPKPLPGLVTTLVVLACAWFGGLGPGLLVAPLLLVLARLDKEPPERWAALSPQEIGILIVITLMAGSTGLAGRYRRRIRAITEQHAQRLRDQAQALNQAPIIFRDVEGRITQWSEGAERLLGWRAADVRGRILHELLQTRFPCPLQKIRAELEDSGQWQGEVVHRHQDGREIHVAAHWILYRDQHDQPIGVAEVHNDVTDLRRAEAALRESDRRKDEFLAVLAHELRNPLAPIRSGLELMKMVQDDPPLIAETRDIMERQMQQLVMLVDDLLDVSRISRGKLELRMCRVALADVVASAVEAARPAIDDSGHRLTVTLPQSTLWLNADPHRLAQVLSNLLDNAAKYTPPGGSICVAAEVRDHQVVIAVRDTGYGIPVDMLDRIFEMFTRSERSERSVHAGLGIGLSLVRSLVQLHGGCVEARSEGTGHGAEFRVTLPLAADVDADLPEPDAGVPAATAAAGERRVLIVDDNHAAADLLSAVVQRIGNQVRVAYDGEEAIDVADAFRPDVVLMDLGMPRLDGYGAARRMRQQAWGKDMLLVALTGWGQDGDKQRAREAGFDHHLVKPADPAVLQRLLADVAPRCS